MKLFRLSVVCLFAALAVAPWSTAQTPGKHPFLGGRWELDKKNSTLGSMPKMDKYVEIIEQDEPRILITAEERASGQTKDSRIIFQYYTDRREAATEINGMKIVTKSKWEGEKLVTLITPPNGQQMIEMRYLSKDKKYQAVDLYMGSVGGSKKPDQERIMIYRGPK